MLYSDANSTAFSVQASATYRTTLLKLSLFIKYCSPLDVTTFLDLNFWIRMKSSIAAGLFSVTMDMLKAASEVGTKWMTCV